MPTKSQIGVSTLRKKPGIRLQVQQNIMVIESPEVPFMLESSPAPRPTP